MITSELLQLARRQEGALARRQLIGELGWSTSQLHRARQNGTLVRVAVDVDRLASAPDSFAFRCCAASLIRGGVGFVSGYSAARWRGLRKMRGDRVHLTVPTNTTVRVPSWVDLHWTRWFDASRDVDVMKNSLRIATPNRMMFGLAADFNQFRFNRAADDAWNLKLIDPADLWRFLQDHRCRGKDGVLKIETWLERAAEQLAPSQSYLERDIIDAVEQRGLPQAVRQYPLVLRNSQTIRLDAAWPDIKFAIEPGHSWWHPPGKDHARDMACVELGWMIMRLDEQMLQDRAACVESVVRAYRSRRAVYRF